jgi:FkbM family methyltransferase
MSKEGQIQALLESLSWKITAPLRRIFDFLLRLKRFSIQRSRSADRDKTETLKPLYGASYSSNIEPEKQRNGRTVVDFRIGLSAAVSGLKLRGYVPEVVYDVGAADGAWTRSVLKIWPDARYVCFEPLVEWGGAMTSLAEEFPEHVQFRQIGLADTDTELPLGITESLYDSSFAYPGRTSRLVEVCRLDTVVQTGLSFPNFVKIDVQGFERRVIEGGRETIAHADLVLMECTFIPFCGEMVTLDETIALMSRNGFVPYEFVDFLRRPLDGAMGQCDILFVKKGHWLIQDHRWRA